MRNLKKFLALVLAMMMTLSLMVTVNAAAGFDDDEDITFNEAVEMLSNLGVLKGYGEGDPNEGKFLPKNPISRAEMSAVLYRIVTGDTDDAYVHLYKGYTEFSDVKDGDWFAPYVNYCANNGLILGRGNGTFDPRANVTGYETLVMILRAIGYNNPQEFSNDDWKFKASGYGARLGLTANVATGSLGGAAQREVVAEIMWQGLQAATVKYSPLIPGQYATDLLVDASEVNPSDPAQAIYEKDVPNTLLYQTFGIVGKCNALGLDKYGRPGYMWMYDDATDTVENGGKYIPNYIDVSADPVATDGSANPKTPGATYNADEEGWFLSVPVKKIYKGEVVTECQFTKDVNGDKSIAAANIREFLNGGRIATRDAALDINHTQEGTIGAPGRITEVYKVGNVFYIVYIDTFMGVVTSVSPVAYDTAGNHVMVPARREVKVNDDVTVVETSNKNFSSKVGDLVLLNTWGFGEADSDSPIDDEHLQTAVPQTEDDFKYNGNWAVEGAGKVTPEEVTVKGTLGTRNHKTGVETNKGDKYANVVFMASYNNGGPKDDADPVVGTGVQYYKDLGATDIDYENDTTVPSTSPYNYGYRMANAAINKSYTIYKDENGFVVGMTATEVGTDIGVVRSFEPKRIATGKWAMEVNMFMADGSEKTVLMLGYSDDGETLNSSAPSNGDATKVVYFKSQGEAEDEFLAANLNIDENTLVKIKAYVKDGATYYKPIETNEGKYTDFSAAVAAEDSNVVTGVANTLDSSAEYTAKPTGTENVYNLDDDTQFIIAQVDWDYSLNEGNQGGYDDLELNVYTGFTNIPTIEDSDDNGCVVYQRIDNTVYVHPDALDDDLNYTVKKAPTYAVDDTYLVYKIGTTYQEYSVYKTLKNGENVDLKVSNNNLKLVNDKIEEAMANGWLIRPSSTNSKGYITDVAQIKEDVDGGVNRTHTIAAATEVKFDKHGVLWVNTPASHPTDATDSSGVSYLTVAEGCVVKIVNTTTGIAHPATLDSIMQYENWTGSHAFTYELNQYGYISCIYIMD